MATTRQTPAIPRRALWLAAWAVCALGCQSSDTPRPQTCDAPEMTCAPDTGEEPVGDALDVPGPDDAGPACTPGSFRCASVTHLEVCLSAEEGWQRQACGEGAICELGRCVEGDSCVPGEALGCLGESIRKICAEDGARSVDEPCTQPTPYCFAGQCIETSCLPERIFCDGENRVRCSANGMGDDLLERCEHGCEAGECVAAPDLRCGQRAHVGCDFWAVDLDNYARRCDTTLDCSIGVCDSNLCVEEDANRQPFTLELTNVSDAPVDVDVVGPSFVTGASLQLAPRASRALALPRLDILETTMNGRAWRVQSSGPITAHQFNPAVANGVFSSEGSLLLPSQSLGTEYRVLGWPTPRQPSLATYPSTNKAYATIVAAEPGRTYVEVTTPVAITAGPQVEAIPAGATREFTLDEGMALQLSTVADSTAEYDLSGLHITATKFLAVFSGHECAFVPTDTPACDHLEEQLLPISAWGTSYVVPRFKPRGSEPDYVRVLAHVDQTLVETIPPLEGADGVTLAAGETLEFATDQSIELRANHPIAVGQFMVGAVYPGPLAGCDPSAGVEYGCAIDARATCEVAGLPFEFPIGDPAFTLAVPTRQFRAEYDISTPAGYLEDFISIVAPDDALIEIDGAPLTDPGVRIPGSPWRVTRLPVSPGVHRVRASRPVAVYAWGHACFVSYAFPAGMNTRTNP